MSFLDTYVWYLFIHPADAKKTTFVTASRVYYYKWMPFGLKSAGGTYQRLVVKAFRDQFESHVEAYIDDMVVKAREAPLLVANV